VLGENPGIELLEEMFGSLIFYLRLKFDAKETDGAMIKNESAIVC
jgi:hypothetical protein